VAMSAPSAPALLLVVGAMLPAVSQAFSVAPMLAPRMALASSPVSGAHFGARASVFAPGARAALLRAPVAAARRTVGGAGACGVSMGPEAYVFEGLKRVVSCLPYILPLLDSLAYGRFLFQKMPMMGALFMTPLAPFIAISQSFPMASFVAFLGLFLFVVRNKAIPRFIRFNTMQALLMEIMMIFPQILTSGNMGGIIPFVFTEFISNMTFYAIASIVGYSCWCNLQGELPCKIPVVSTAVFQQIGGGAGFDN